MQNQENTTGKRIVAFHIGRGGRFNNQGHIKFLGENNIGYFTNELCTRFENEDTIFKAIGNRENLIQKFEECRENEDFSFFKKLGFEIGEKEYYSPESGSSVELTEKDVEIGVGRINIDHGYDTTYTSYLEDCDENEMRLIIEYSGYVDSQIVEYCKEILGED